MTDQLGVGCRGHRAIMTCLSVAVLIALACCSQPSDLKSAGYVRLADFEKLSQCETGAVLPDEVREGLERAPHLRAFHYSLAKDGGVGDGFLVVTAGGGVVMKTGGVLTYATEGKGGDLVRPWGYQSITRSKSDRGRACDDFLSKMIEDAGKQELLGEIRMELTRHESPNVFHFVAANETGGWQFGVLVVEADGSLILKRKLGVEY